MVASAVFITDTQGKHIISRNYRGDVPITKAVEIFAKYLTEIPEEQKKPVFYHDGEFMAEDEAGATGNKGETFVYVSVSTLVDCRRRCCCQLLPVERCASPQISQNTDGQSLLVCGH
jgi:AP-1 complex subunit mu